MAVEPRSGKLSYDDLLAFPDDRLRHELIDGEDHVSPSPSPRHQTLVLRLGAAFDRHLCVHGGGRVFVAPCDVVLSPHDVVVPDVVFVDDSRSAIVTARSIDGVPSLLVEVLSDARRDRRLKRDLYARFGVPEYWIVDPEAERVEVFRLDAGGYGKPEILEPPEMLTPLAPSGLELDLTDLFRP